MRYMQRALIGVLVVCAGIVAMGASISSSFACTTIWFTEEQLAAYAKILDSPTPIDPSAEELGFPAWSLDTAIGPLGDAVSASVEAAGQPINLALTFVPSHDVAPERVVVASDVSKTVWVGRSCGGKSVRVSAT
jgi:hypothetical protein